VATEGTFVLADIGGYTSFLSGVGIEHGKEATQHLLNTIVKAGSGSWKVGNVMGDCVLFYCSRREPPADVFARVKSVYEAFCDAQADIASGSTCRCGACDRTQELSLKFVVHAGEFDVQNIGGRKELIGRDIVVATRLLKNSVPVREYIIATPQVSAVADEATGTPVTASEELEGIGSVEYSYVDLQPVREKWSAAREFYLTREDSKLSVEAEINAPVEVVWDAIHDLKKRAVWQVTIDEMSHIQGAEGEVGEVHSCLHGGTEIVHITVGVDEANHRKTEKVWVSIPIMKDIFITVGAEPLEEGRSRGFLYATFKPRYPVLSHVLRPFFKWYMGRDIKKDMAGLKEFCERGSVAVRDAATTR
jgi:hypothetical protein